MAKLPLIAVVDDDAPARAAIAALVEAMGFRTRCFAGAADFLRSPEARTAQAVIADLRMQGMSGLELCRVVRAGSVPMRTVLMTAYPDPATERYAREAGIDGYLAKPCDPEALLACLRPGLAGPETEPPRRSRPIPR